MHEQSLNGFSLTILKNSASLPEFNFADSCALLDKTGCGSTKAEMLINYRVSKSFLSEYDG